MEKLSFVLLLVAISLVQDVTPADWPTLQLCGSDEPSDDRDSTNTVSLTRDDENCIPTDTPMKGEAEATYYLRPRKTFYGDISDIYGGPGSDDVVEVQAVQQADVGVRRNSCILQTEDDEYFVKFFIDEDAVMALFYLIIGTVKRRFQFYQTGLNLAGQRPLQTTYNFDQLPLTFLSVLVLSEDNRTVSIFDYEVCKAEGNIYTPVFRNSLVFDTTPLEGICNTFDLDGGLLRAGNLTLSNGDLVDLLFDGKPSIQVVAVPGNCNDSELQDSAQVITISRFATTSSTTMQTPTPTSGGTDSTNTPTGNGGLNAIAITAVVIASIVGVGIVVAVIIAIFCHRPLGKWLKKIITNMRRHRTEAPGDIELSDQLNDDPRMKEPEDDTKRTLVLNLWPDGDELEELLYDGNPGTIPESDKKDAHKLTALITKDNCQFFYLVRRVSREELRTANETAWELLRDFNTRFFPSKVLQKFIDVWVFDENKVVGGFPELVPGPILTVNVPLNKWRGNMKGCAQWVRMKARTNIDSPDGRFSASHTPSATESPPRFTTELEPVETTVDSPLAVVTTVEAAVMQTPEAYLPHHQPPLLHQPPTESLSHLPEKPHPQSPNQPPPPYTNPNPESNVLSDILHELKKLNVTEEKVAANMQKTADNTRDMKGTQEDTRALAEEIHEAVTEPPEDTPEAV